MTRHDLFLQIKKKQSYLCIGLDTDLNKIPRHLLKNSDPVFEFNKQIIDATQEYCVAYKPNVAFYEALGPKGWESLQKTEAYFPDDIFSIADAKRGDIGNTSELYAKAFFEQMDFDSITVAPYMGKDSVVPFLYFKGTSKNSSVVQIASSPRNDVRVFRGVLKNRWVILLAHTSNEGSQDFQLFDSGKRKLYEEVIVKSQAWSSPDNLMYVVGATRADKIGEIRKLAPEHFFLVPGLGAQGGDLNDVSKVGMNKQCGLLVNSSRAIIYASPGEDFAEAARREAKNVRDEMVKWLDKI